MLKKLEPVTKQVGSNYGATQNLNTPLYKDHFQKGDDDYWSPTTVVSENLPIVSKQFTEKELEKWVRWAYTQFYFRPRYILKALMRTRSISKLTRAIRVGLLVIFHLGSEFVRPLRPLQSAGSGNIVKETL